MVDIHSHPASSVAAARQFGLTWAEAWGRGDVEAVLDHFSEDCVFESPLAEKHVGTTRVRGKSALRAYWLKALAAIGTVNFVVDFVAIESERRAIAILYRAGLGDRRVHACERYIFGDDGLVRSGMGIYGPPVLDP